MDGHSIGKYSCEEIPHTMFSTFSLHPHPHENVPLKCKNHQKNFKKGIAFFQIHARIKLRTVIVCTKYLIWR